MSNCNKCQAEIIWDKPFVSGSRPKNPDSTLHECMKTGPAQTKITESKPTQTPNSVLEEAIVFAETFKDTDSAKFESLAKIYISGRMRR